MKTIFAATLLTFGIAGLASADIINISGTPVTVTSSFNGGQSQTAFVTAGDTIEIGGGTFSWMSAGDYIDFAVDPSDPTRNELKVFFASSDHFLGTDYVSLNVGFAPDLHITNAAIIHALSTTVDNGVLVGDRSFIFDIQGLGQINPTFGDMTLLYFVDVPEPGTIGLALAGAAALFLRRRR